MADPRRAPDAPTRSFRASWFSSFGLLALVCGLFVALFAWMLTDSSAPRLVAAGGLLFFGAGLVLMLMQFVGPGAVLSLGAQGITGRWLRGHTIAWHEIEDIEHHRVQGADQLVITLAPDAPSLAATRRLLNGRTAMRAVPLGALRKRERQGAVDAVMAAFHARGGPSRAAGHRPRWSRSNGTRCWPRSSSTRTFIATRPGHGRCTW